VQTLGGGELCMEPYQHMCFYQSGDYNSEDRFAELDRKLKEKEVIIIFKFINHICDYQKLIFLINLVHDIVCLYLDCFLINFICKTSKMSI
jgi:hypothetical protein